MATAFNCPPAVLYGLTNTEDQWLAYQVNRAVYRFGSWMKSKIEETVERQAKPASKRRTERVPKYTSDDIHRMIYGNIVTRDQLSAIRAEAKAVQSGQVNPLEIEAEEDYIPPSFRKKSGVVPQRV